MAKQKKSCHAAKNLCRTAGENQDGTGQRNILREHLYLRGRSGSRLGQCRGVSPNTRILDRHRLRSFFQLYGRRFISTRGIDRRDPGNSTPATAQDRATALELDDRRVTVE